MLHKNKIIFFSIIALGIISLTTYLIYNTFYQEYEDPLKYLTEDTVCYLQFGSIKIINKFLDEKITSKKTKKLLAKFKLKIFLKTNPITSKLLNLKNIEESNINLSKPLTIGLYLKNEKLIFQYIIPLKQKNISPQDINNFIIGYFKNGNTSTFTTGLNQKTLFLCNKYYLKYIIKNKYCIIFQSEKTEYINEIIKKIERSRLLVNKIDYKSGQYNINKKSDIFTYIYIKEFLSYLNIKNKVLIQAKQLLFGIENITVQTNYNKNQLKNIININTIPNSNLSHIFKNSDDSHEYFIKNTNLKNIQNSFVSLNMNYISDIFKTFLLFNNKLSYKYKEFKGSLSAMDINFEKDILNSLNGNFYFSDYSKNKTDKLYLIGIGIKNYKSINQSIDNFLSFINKFEDNIIVEKNKNYKKYKANDSFFKKYEFYLTDNAVIVAYKKNYPQIKLQIDTENLPTNKFKNICFHTKANPSKLYTLYFSNFYTEHYKDILPNSIEIEGKKNNFIFQFNFTFNF